MSMYKNIFVNEEYDGIAEGAKVLGVNGEVLIFGQSAFASLDEATKDADIANSVIRVTTGAYDEFYVADANENIVKANRVVAMDFTGGVVENADGVTVEVAAPTPEQMPVEKQQALIADLNDAYADKGIVFVDAEKYSAADQTLVYIESDLVNSDLTVKKVSLVCPESVFEEDAVEALDDVPEVQLVCPVADTAPVCKEEYEDLLDEFLNSPLLQFS